MTDEQRARYNAKRRERWALDPEFRQRLVTYRKANPDKVKVYARRYKEKHKDEMRDSLRRQRETDCSKFMWRSAKCRAKKLGIPFTIKHRDIYVPSVCPVLGIPLAVSTGAQSDNSPSLDRILPALGYVKGNIAVISRRANTIKQNATSDEIFRVALWLKNQEQQPALRLVAPLEEKVA